MGVGGWLATLVSACAGGAVFALLTGKGTTLDSGVILTLLVVLTVFHATRELVRHTSLSAPLRYAAIPLLLLPLVALYASIYKGISLLLADLPVVTAPATWTLFHGIVAVVFLGAYLAIETKLYQRSERLYVALLNATRPPSGTVLTRKEAYREC